MDKIIANIVKYRKGKDIPIKQMAHLLEMSYAGYKKIEYGKTDISLKRLASICSILGISFNDLLDFNPKDFNPLQSGENVDYIDILQNELVLKDKLIQILEQKISFLEDSKKL